ncbi:MFS transporter [Streptomyces mayonensis]|uniref:MFS transporter n=1 Tax=Streptomyces mayonensis TaxID=2750816 RepID=UPI001C1DE48B|nr:MFS transporter [Streptomyces sp. A108]MBU6531387.1 MFS transporter [Streptomyces sp. A108]
MSKAEKASMPSPRATPSDRRPPVPGARRIVAYTFMFFTGMWLSKTVHPLYFDAHDDLVHFGLSYTAMAVAGTTSVFIGRLSDQWGPRAVLVGGTVLYSAGMTLRVVHDSAVVAVASGLVAGLGASSVFIGLRTWTLHHTTEEQRVSIVSRREFMTQAGTALGMGSAGALAAFVGAGDRGYVCVLLLAAACVLAGLFLLPPTRTGTVSAAPAKAGEAGFATVFRKHRGLVFGVVGLGFLMGSYVSILSPYLPLLLAERGVPVALVGVVLAVAGVVRLTAAAVAGKYLRERSPLAVFLVSESCCAAATLVLALSVSPWLAACALAVRGAFLLGATVSQELLQLNAFPSALAGVLFGLVQSAFLAGDSLGGAVGGWLYHQLGSSHTVLIATGLTLANALLVPAFYGRLRRLAETDPQRQSAHATT